MIIYLNKKGILNQNSAREVMELHALGVSSGYKLIWKNLRESLQDGV